MFKNSYWRLTQKMFKGEQRMLQIGQEVRIKRGRTDKNNRRLQYYQGYIFATTPRLIVIMFTEDGKDLYREAFNRADIADSLTQIEVKEQDAWRGMTSKDFKGLKSQATSQYI